MNSSGSFRAFVSYCHADRSFAAALQRRLEGYRLPRRLAERVAPMPGQARGSIGPVFRDRADFSAAQDLSAAVREAIAASSAMVVVASPDAVGSVWVGREIELFRQLHPDAPILVALARGEPADSTPAALGAEPLAADFRPEGDGRRLAFLKIVAGLARLPLDALVQRDAQRTVRRVMAVTLGAGAIALVMTALLIVALQARSEAERQRAEAEGLVKFMLTDLRHQLKEVGSLQIMEGANQRAFVYFGRRGNPDRLSDDSKLLRAVVLHALAEDSTNAGDIQRASGYAAEAYHATEGVLQRHPQSADAIFTHAQSEFWVGNSALERDAPDLDGARSHFARYASLAGRLVAIDPRRSDYQLERAYADDSLGAIEVKQKRLDRALALFLRGRTSLEIARRIAPDDFAVLTEFANNHGWVADGLFSQGRFGEAFRERSAQRALVDQLVRQAPWDARRLRTQVVTAIGQARIALKLNRSADALALLRGAEPVAGELASRSPDNRKYRQSFESIKLRIAGVIIESARPSREDRALIGAARSACLIPSEPPRTGELLDICKKIGGSPVRLSTSVHQEIRNGRP